MAEWSTRPLEKVYAAIFINAVPSCAHGTIRYGRAGNGPVHAAIGVDLAGHKDVLGLWAARGDGTETAKFWTSVLSELKDRGVADVFFVVCDDLDGLQDAVASLFPQAVVQSCIAHLIRNTYRYASPRHWGQLTADLKLVCGAGTRELAWRAFEEFEERWATTYPAIGRLWRDAWEQFTPFLDYDVEIRKVLCSANAIEPLNAHHRRTVTVRGPLPAEQAALKCLYLVFRSLDPNGTDPTCPAVRWRHARNAFAATFADRIPTTEGT